MKKELILKLKNHGVEFVYGEDKSNPIQINIPSIDEESRNEVLDLLNNEELSSVSEEEWNSESDETEE